jgi:hypothetical protein
MNPITKNNQRGGALFVGLLIVLLIIGFLYYRGTFTGGESITSEQDRENAQKLINTFKKDADEIEKQIQK